MHRPQVRHLGRTPELVGPDLGDRREDGRHRVVDPHVDRPEFRLRPVGGRLHLAGVGHVGRDHERASTEGAHLVRRLLETGLTPGDQCHRRSAASELVRHRATDPGGRPGHDDHPGRPRTPRRHDRSSAAFSP